MLAKLKIIAGFSFISLLSIILITLFVAGFVGFIFNGLIYLDTNNTGSLWVCLLSLGLMSILSGVAIYFID